MSWLLTVVAALATTYNTYTVSLVDCYDGDTCTFNFHLGMQVQLSNETVRLCDINAPEIRPLATREAATKTRDRLLAILKAAKKIEAKVPQSTRCEPGSCDKTGKYGRTLVKLYADGVYVNQLLVDEGLAELYLECR